MIVHEESVQEGLTDEIRDQADVAESRAWLAQLKAAHARQQTTRPELEAETQCKRREVEDKTREEQKQEWKRLKEKNFEQKQEPNTQRGLRFSLFGPTGHGKLSFGNGFVAFSEDTCRVSTYNEVQQSKGSVTSQNNVRRQATTIYLHNMPRPFADINLSLEGKGPWDSKVLSSLQIEDENSGRNKEGEENTNKVKIKKLLEVEGGGCVYATSSLPQDAGLSLSPFPGLQQDIVVISRTSVPIGLTISFDPHSDVAVNYNRKLATLLLRKMRKYVDEDFTFAFGVVGEDDTESLLDRVKTLRERSTRFALRRYLIMTPEKCESLTRGLVSMLSEMKL